jgi:serine/threonine protein kinase/WD40 repeat protein
MNESNGHFDTVDDRLSALLMAWQESVAVGKPLSVATLCADSPELATELEREIAWLQNLDRFMPKPRNLADRETVDAPSLANSSRPVPDSAEFEIPGFEILEELGRGGMSVVYKARQKSLHRFVAIKTLAVSRWAQPGFAARLKQEAKALSQLKDAHIVQVFDVIDTPVAISLVLEYIDGGNLAEQLKGMPLPPMEAAQIALTLARTMSKVHQQGLYHRDIKPSNILIDCGSGIKIADFGLAKEEGSAGLQTATGDFFGTPSYTSPEQAAGRKAEIDARTDVYAIGATLYDMLTGRPPFSGASTVDILKQLLDRDPIAPRLLIPGIPRDLETICLKCLEKEPENRFTSAQELADELERALQGHPIRSRPTSIVVRFVKWCRRRPAVAALVGLSLMMTITIVGLVASSNQSLKRYNQDLIAAAAKASESQRIAEESERRTKDNLYASDISRAAMAWKREDTRELTELLDRHRPGPGEIDRRGFEWRYLHRQAHLARRVLLETSEPIYTLCFSTDRKWLTAAGKDAIVRFIDPDRGNVWKEFPTGQKEVNGIAFSPDGTEFATAGDDGTIRFWTIETGEERLKITTPLRKAYELVYTPDGTRIIACGDSPVIHIFDVQTGQDVAKLEGHADIVESLRLADDGKTLISESNDNTTKFWNLDDRTLQNSINVPNHGGPAVYDQRRGLQFTGNELGVLRTFDVNNDREIDSVKQIDSVSALALHPEGVFLAVGDQNGRIRLRRIDAEGRFVDVELQPWQAHQGKVHSFVWSSDGLRLISAGKDGRVLSWSLDAAQRTEPRRFVIDQSKADWSIALWPSLFLKKPNDGELIRWNPSPETPLDSSIRKMALLARRSCDGKFFAFSPHPSKLQLFAVPDVSVPSAEVHKLAETHLSGICLGFTTGSKYAVANEFVRTGTKESTMEQTCNDEDSHLLLFSIPRLDIVARIPISKVNDVAFSPDGMRLVIGTTQALILWDIGGKKVVWSVPRLKIRKVAFSPDGKLIAAAANDRTTVICDTINGETQIQFTTFRSTTHIMTFSPDSRTLVSGTHDEAIVFNHVATGQELLCLENIGRVDRLEFADRNRYLVCQVDQRHSQPTSEVVVLDASDPDFDTPDAK